MANGDTKTEAMLNILGNGGDASSYRGCCNTKTQSYILDAIDRVQSVEDEVEEIKNNPDVVDIVDTYADLQAYDTSTLTDNDVIRVLQDETHSGNSTYYRFTKNPDTWTFIGEISGGGSSTIKLLTNNDLNWDSSGSEGDPDSIALWLLEDGYYAVDPISYPYVLANSDEQDPIDPGAIISIFDLSGYGSIKGIDVIAFWSDYSSYRSYQVQTSDGTTISTDVVSLSEIQNAIQAATYNLQMDYPIPSSTTYGVLGGLYSCGQNQKLYMCTAIDETDPANPVYTWTEVGGGGSGPTVVQTTGTSTTDVMSQNATSLMVFDEPSTKTRIRIGNGSSVGSGTISIGTSSYTNSVNGIAIGGLADVEQNNSVALGYDARTTRAGEVNVGLYNNSTGYNNTHYRVIGGVHDPVDAHDAATKGYVDAHSGGGSSAIQVLTEDDLNWDSSGEEGDPDSIATWLLDAGWYMIDGNASFNVYGNSDNMTILPPGSIFHVDAGIVMALAPDTYGVGDYCGLRLYASDISTGEAYDERTMTFNDVQTAVSVSEEAYNRIQISNAVPTTTTWANEVGCLYSCTANGKLYMCTNIDDTDPDNMVFTWTAIN